MVVLNTYLGLGRPDRAAVVQSTKVESKTIVTMCSVVRIPLVPSRADLARRPTARSVLKYSPIVVRPFQGGNFFSVSLASWSGSSGGPIVDVAASNTEGRPVVLGVLMSSGVVRLRPQYCPRHEFDPDRA